MKEADCAGRASGIVLCIISTVAAHRCRRLLNAWDGEESWQLDKLENRMDILNYLFEFFSLPSFFQQGFSFLSSQGRRAASPESHLATQAFSIFSVCSL